MTESLAAQWLANSELGQWFYSDSGKCASSTTERALHVIQQEIWTAACYNIVLEVCESLCLWNLDLSQHVFVLDILSCHLRKPEELKLR